MPESDEEPDADDEESLRRLDAWLTREHDRCANDMERLDEAAVPLGRIAIDSDEVIDAAGDVRAGQSQPAGTGADRQSNREDG